MDHIDPLYRTLTGRPGFIVSFFGRHPGLESWTAAPVGRLQVGSGMRTVARVAVVFCPSFREPVTKIGEQPKSCAHLEHSPGHAHHDEPNAVNCVDS